MRALDRARLALAGLIAPDGRFGDVASWRGWYTVAKYESADVERWGLKAKPYEVLEGRNLLLTSGANAYHQRLIATAVTAFSSTNARIAVGDGSTAAAASQTDLQGSTKTRKLVDATPTISGNTISFVATFLSTEGNHTWNEAGIVNTGTNGTGDMLNRVVQSFGSKTSGLQWVITGTIQLS